MGTRRKFFGSTSGALRRDTATAAGERIAVKTQRGAVCYGPPDSTRYQEGVTKGDQDQPDRPADVRSRCGFQVSPLQRVNADAIVYGRDVAYTSLRDALAESLNKA